MERGEEDQFLNLAGNHTDLQDLFKAQTGIKNQNFALLTKNIVIKVQIKYS